MLFFCDGYIRDHTYQTTWSGLGDAIEITQPEHGGVIQFQYHVGSCTGTEHAPDHQPLQSTGKEGWSFPWSPGEEVISAGPYATYGPFHPFTTQSAADFHYDMTTGLRNYCHNINLGFLENFFRAQYPATTTAKLSHCLHPHVEDGKTVELLSKPVAIQSSGSTTAVSMHTVANATKDPGKDSTAGYLVTFVDEKLAGFTGREFCNPCHEEQVETLQQMNAFTKQDFGLVVEYSTASTSPDAGAKRKRVALLALESCIKKLMQQGTGAHCGDFILTPSVAKGTGAQTQSFRIKLQQYQRDSNNIETGAGIKVLRILAQAAFGKSSREGVSALEQLILVQCPSGFHLFAPAHIQSGYNMAPEFVGENQ